MNAKLYKAFEGTIQPIFQKPWEREIYSLLEPDWLLQKGDEYLTQDMQFQPIPLTVIGTKQQPSITYRRRRF